MRTGVVWALISTGIVVAAAAVAGAAFSFFAWALALNGFMGQGRAVDASMITFIVLAAVSSLACIALGLYAVYYLAVKRNWHAAGAAAISITVFSIVVGGLELLSLLISVLVADQMRTTK